MKGDISRNTFDRQQRFSRVLMQQGRVLLDADWNEQTSILLHYLRTLAADLIGPHGGPGDAFKIECNENHACDFTIGWGHYYVGGILVENLPPVQCPSLAAPQPLPYSEQPDYPLTDDEKLGQGNNYLVYLDVWERHMTHLEAGHIREAALGGPDTATRTKVVWQVKVVSEEECGHDAFNDTNCEDLLQAWVEEKNGPRCLRARARVDEHSDDPCIIPPQARYRGPENQLYRVEIHDAGTPGDGKEGATYKWSRDNGSIVFPIRALQGSLLKLDTLGPDERRGLKEGDWVEVIDDRYVLRGEPGILAMVEAVDRVKFEVTLVVPEDIALPVFDEGSTTHPLLRRWDQASKAVPVTEGKWIDLEDGVQIYFEPGGTYRTGDYWLIPARTGTGDVLWPTEEGEEGMALPKALPPDGIEHHYAPLARISLNAAGVVNCENDCRCILEHRCDRAERLGQPPERAPIRENERPVEEERSSVDEQRAELVRITNIGTARADMLMGAGRDTPEIVAAMSTGKIGSLLNVNDRLAASIRESAREIARRQEQ